ncbi:hypothetical protein A2U01_0090080, partial [Trifolium medium]|nr:hypothetical protein [Trifolium medium]
RRSLAGAARKWQGKNVPTKSSLGARLQPQGSKAPQCRKFSKFIPSASQACNGSF